MSGILYVVGTPIGNLSDMTFRAIEILKSVDFVACEDTRVSAKLLNYFEIKKPLVSYYKHNAKASGEHIIQKILEGENAAVITDAGMPCISDPGEDLVKMCYKNNICVNVVPGPSAVISALAISGQDTSRFSFEGFLSTTKKNRYEHLASVSNNTSTLIFYEAPHKLLATLKDMLKFFGDRKISLCRELTKIHETVMNTTLSEAYEYYCTNNPKGEFVLIIKGKTDYTEEKLSIDDAITKVEDLITKGVRATDACKEIAKLTDYSKSDLYTKIIEKNK